MRNKLLILVIILLVALGAYSLGTKQKGSTKTGDKVTAPADSFDDCVKAGNPVMESYPRKCKTGEKTFTEDIGNEIEKKDLIIIDSPRPNQLVSSPLKISGKARGTWYFEASFPVILKDGNGNQIASGVAQAKSEWMTTEFVPFESEIVFQKPETLKGVLILKKDNPSGLAANDDELKVPVGFE